MFGNLKERMKSSNYALISHKFLSKCNIALQYRIAIFNRFYHTGVTARTSLLSIMPTSEVDFFMKGDTNAKVHLTGYYESAVRPSPAALLRQLITSVAPSWAYVRQGRQAESCSICSQSLRKGAVVRKLKCKHVFHAECIDEWLKKSFTCGFCRQALF